MRPCLLLTRVVLRFAVEHEDVVGDLSAVARISPTEIWVASDERRAIERLHGKHGKVFGAQERLLLADHLDLPDAGEVDVEAMDADGAHCWLTGSHGTVRAEGMSRWSWLD